METLTIICYVNHQLLLLTIYHKHLVRLEPIRRRPSRQCEPPVDVVYFLSPQRQRVVNVLRCLCPDGLNIAAIPVVLVVRGLKTPACFNCSKGPHSTSANCRHVSLSPAAWWSQQVSRRMSRASRSKIVHRGGPCVTRGDRLALVETRSRARASSLASQHCAKFRAICRGTRPVRCRWQL